MWAAEKGFVLRKYLTPHVVPTASVESGSYSKELLEACAYSTAASANAYRAESSSDLSVDATSPKEKRLSQPVARERTRVASSVSEKAYQALSPNEGSSRLTVPSDYASEVRRSSVGDQDSQCVTFDDKHFRSGEKSASMASSSPTVSLACLNFSLLLLQVTDITVSSNCVTVISEAGHLPCRILEGR